MRKRPKFFQRKVTPVPVKNFDLGAALDAEEKKIEEALDKISKAFSGKLPQTGEEFTAAIDSFTMELEGSLKDLEENLHMMQKTPNYPKRAKQTEIDILKQKLGGIQSEIERLAIKTVQDLRATVQDVEKLKEGKV